MAAKIPLRTERRWRQLTEEWFERSPSSRPSASHRGGNTGGEGQNINNHNGIADPGQLLDAAQAPFTTDVKFSLVKNHFGGSSGLVVSIVAIKKPRYAISGKANRGVTTSAIGATYL